MRRALRSCLITLIRLKTSDCESYIETILRAGWLNVSEFVIFHNNLPNQISSKLVVILSIFKTCLEVAFNFIV
jgi:hypothetical protein